MGSGDLHHGGWVVRCLSHILRTIPEKGLEPSHSCEYWILNPTRLPFRHSGLGKAVLDGNGEEFKRWGARQGKDSSCRGYKPDLGLTFRRIKNLIETPNQAAFLIKKPLPGSEPIAPFLDYVLQNGFPLEQITCGNLLFGAKGKCNHRQEPALV